MVGGNPKTLLKMDNLVRGHPKTLEKPVAFKIMGKAPKLFYAVALGQKIGVLVNKLAETEILTKHFKGARFRSFKVPQDAYIYILNENKDAPIPNILLEFYKLSENEITHFRSEMLKDRLFFGLRVAL